MSRRHLVTLLALVMIAALSLAACTPGSTTPTAAPKTTAPAQTPAQTPTPAPEPTPGYTLPIADGSVTLRYAGNESQYAPVSLADNLPVFQKIEEITGIKIEWEVVPSSQYATTMQVRLAANQDIPDIFEIPASDVLKYSGDGILLEISDLIAQYAPNILALWDRLPTVKIAQITPEGKIYSVCLVTEGNAAFVVRTPLIRKDFLEDVNLPIPETLDDWYTVLKAFKDNGVAVPITDWQGGTYTSFRQAFGLYSSFGEYKMYLDENGRVVYPYINDEYKQYLTYMNKLYSEGLMDQEVYQADLNAANSLVVKNMVGATQFNNSLDTYWNNMLKQAGIDGEYIFIPQPKGYDGSDPAYVRQAVARARYGFSAKTKYPEEAIQWADFLFSEQGTVLLNFGIEGKSYEMVDGKPKLTDWALTNPDGLDTYSALRSLGAFQSVIRLDSVELIRQMTNPIIVAFAEDPANNITTPYPAVIATAEEGEQMSQIMTDVQTRVSEMEMQFIIGTKSLDEFDAFVAELKELGVEDVVAIKQAQYDRISGN